MGRKISRASPVQLLPLPAFHFLGGTTVPSSGSWPRCALTGIRAEGKHFIVKGGKETSRWTEGGSEQAEIQ